MSMVQRVARVIRENGDLDAETLARLAITAMIEPTPRMVAAAAKAMSPGGRTTPEWVSAKEKHRMRYRAMLLAELDTTCQVRLVERHHPQTTEAVSG